MANTLGKGHIPNHLNFNLDLDISISQYWMVIYGYPNLNRDLNTPRF